MGDTVATPANNGIPGAINSPVPGATSIDENGVARDQSGKVLAQNVQTPTDQPDSDPWGVKSVGSPLPQDAASDPWGVKSVGPDQVKGALDSVIPKPAPSPIDKYAASFNQMLTGGESLDDLYKKAQEFVNSAPPESTKGTPYEGIAKVGKFVSDLAKSAWAAQQNETDTAKQYWNQSDKSKNLPAKIGYSVSGGIRYLQGGLPLAGPALGAIEDSFTNGEYAKGLGMITALLTPGAAEHFGPSVIEGIKNTAVKGRAVVNSDAVLETRTAEATRSAKQASDAHLAAQQAEQDHAEGKITDKQKIDAQNTASEAASNARKAQQAMLDAQEAKQKAAVEAAKSSKKVVRDARAKDASDKLTTQSKGDFNQAFPASKAAPYTENDLEVGRGYIEHQHGVEPITDTKGMYDALEASRQGVEDQVREAIGGVADQPLKTDLRAKVFEGLSQNTAVKDYAAKGMAALDQYNIDDDMNLGRSDELRAQLNAELRGTLQEKKWSVSDAMAKDPEFAAKKILADTLRDSIYDRMDDLGIENADVLRQHESSLIRLRDAVERQLYKGNQKLRGSGASPAKHIAYKAAGTVLGGSAGATIGGGLGSLIGLGREGAELGGLYGGQLGARIGDRFAPSDLTRDQMSARIGNNTKAALVPPEIEKPAAYPVVGPTSRDFSPLHKSLATHYGEVLGKSAYSDLENRFMDDVNTKQQYGVPLEPNETKLLDQLNDQHMKDMWDAHEQVQKSAIMQEQPTEPTLPRNFEPAQEIEGNIQPGMGTHEALVHDMAHHVVANELLGDKLPSLGIASGSHAENMAAGSLASAQFDWSHYIDEDGNFDMNKVEKDLPQLTAMYVAGGAANDLYHGVPMSGNHHLGADFGIIRELMGELGLTPAEQKEMIRIGGEHAAEILKRPGTQDTLEAHALVREPNLDPSMHMSPDRVQQILEDVKEANRESGTTSSNESANGNAKDADADKESSSTRDEQSGRPAKGSTAAGLAKVEDEEQPAKGNGQARKGNKGNAPGDSRQSAEGAETPVKPKPENPKFAAETPDLTHRTTEKGGEVRLDSEQEGLLKNHGLLKYTNTADDTAAVTAANLDKDFRGQGLGQKMYEEAANQARQAGKKYLTSDLNGQTSYDAGQVWDRLSKKYPGEIEQVKSKAGSPGYRWDLSKANEEGIKPQNPKFAEAPKEGISTGNEDFDKMIRDAGGVPKGTLKGMPEVGLEHHALYDDQNKSTLATKFSQMTPENIKANLDRSHLAYAPENAVKTQAATGGFSFNPHDGSVPTDGYMVETHLDRGKDLGHVPTAEDIKQYMADNKDVLDANKNLHIGGWGNTLGISERIPDLDAALKAGKDRNQIAIYDLKNGKDIQTGGTGEVKPSGIQPTNPKFSGNRVSTRVPSGKAATENPLEGEPLEIGRAAVEASPQKLQDKFAQKARDTAGVKIPKNITDNGKVYDRFVRHIADNLKWLYDQVSKEQQQANAKWYESANKLAGDMSDQHGVTKPQSAGVIAALSPQMDWDANVSLAERTHDIWKNHKDEVVTPEMIQKGKDIIDFSRKGKAKGANANLEGILPKIEGKKIGDLTGLEQAAAVRLYDEVHNSREFHRIDPATGNKMELRTNVDGSPAGAGWSNFNNIAKALSILEDGSRKNISEQVGDSHKVRNFYNNIIDPTHPNDVTIDTHAVGAATLQPLSGNAKEVSDNFGSAGGAKNTGVKGNYPLYAEGYRLAAKELGLKARELQSVTWEKVRDMFPAEWKTADNLARVKAEWKNYTDGKQDVDTTRQNILKMSTDAQAEVAAKRAGAAAKRQSKAAKEAGSGAITGRINALDFIKAMQDNKAEQAPKPSGVKNALSGQPNLFGGV